MAKRFGSGPASRGALGPDAGAYTFDPAWVDVRMSLLSSRSIELGVDFASHLAPQISLSEACGGFS